MGRPLLSQQLLVWWKEVKDSGHNKDGYTQTYLTKKKNKKGLQSDVVTDVVTDVHRPLQHE